MDKQKKYRLRKKLAKSYIDRYIGYWSGGWEYSEYDYRNAIQEVFDKDLQWDETYEALAKLTKEQFWQLQEWIDADKLAAKARLIDKNVTTYSSNSSTCKDVRNSLSRSRRRTNRRACKLYERGEDEKAEKYRSEWQHEEYDWEVW